MTFLQHVGSILKKVLHIGTEVAQAVEPEVDLLIPDIAPLYNSAVGLAFTAEASASATTGTGTQKLSQLVTNLVPQVEAWAAANGIVWPTADITKWASAVVDTVNQIPAPTQKPIATPVTTTSTITTA